MTDDPAQREGKAVRLVWVDLEGERIAFANQILAQHHGSEFILTFGQFTPPPLLGSDEEKREALESIDFIPIVPVARIGLSAQRMTEFVRVLQENLRNYEIEGGSRDDQQLDG